MKVFVKIILVLLLIVLAATDLGLLHFGEKFTVGKLINAENDEALQAFLSDHVDVKNSSLTDLTTVKIPFSTKRAVIVQGGDFSALIYNVDVNAESPTASQAIVIGISAAAVEKLTVNDFILYLVLFLMICIIPNRKVRKPSYYAQAGRRRR